MKVTGDMQPRGFARTTAAILLHVQHGAAPMTGRQGAGFATLHQVESLGGRPEIGAGRLLGASELEEVLARVAPQRALTLLPERLLAASAAALVWWKPAARERVWFRSQPPIGEATGIVPHPALVFAVTASGWYVWALRESQRPDEDTALFVAPFFNVWSGGRVCQGSVALPESLSHSSIASIERAFFESRFTHPNVHTRGGLTSFRGGPYALWKSLLSGKRRAFPTQSLVASELTLGAAITKLSQGAL